MTSRTALTGNPFAAELPDLAVHGENCPGPESIPGYVDFAGRPGPPEPALVESGLILIAGRAGLGKSVLAHRCLHVYEDAGYLPVDLGAVPGSEIPDPVTCLDLVLERLRQDGVLSAREIESIGAVGEINPVEEHRALGVVLGDRRLVMRLPRPDPLLEPEAVARNVVTYARSAASARSIYLFEFPYWPEEQWGLLKTELSRLGSWKFIVRRELSSFSSMELTDFLRERSLAETVESVLDFEPESLFGALAGRDAGLGSTDLPWFNRLCALAFGNAIRDGASRVGRSHFLSAVGGGGGR